MKRFKKVKRFINLYDEVIRRFDNDLTDKDTTVFSRYIKITDLHNDLDCISFLSKRLHKSYKKAQDSFYKWHKRGCDVALNKYIEDSIDYIAERPNLLERLESYKTLFRDQKAGFYHSSDKKMIDILTNEQLLRLILAIMPCY